MTAPQDLLLSGQLDVEAGDLLRMFAVLTQVKANALKTKFFLETPTMVPAPKVKTPIGTLGDLLCRFTPPEKLHEVARELRRLAPNAAPACDSAE